MDFDTSPTKFFNHKLFAFVAGIGIFLFYQMLGGGSVATVMFLKKTEWIWFIQSIGQFLFMLIPALYVMKYSPLGMRGLLRGNSRITLAQWIAGLFGILSIQLVVTGLAPLQEVLIPDSLMPMYKNLQFQMQNIYATILGGAGIISMFKGLMVGGIIPAFSEEILFRGVMQTSLEQVYSPFKAILWTAILFGIIHFNPTEIIPLIGIGVYLGILAFYSRSLILPIAAHFLNNVIAIVSMNLLSTTTLNESIEQLPLSIAGLFCVLGLTGILISSFVVIRNKVSEGTSL